MIIIASTKKTISGSRKWHKPTYLIISLIALAVTAISFYFFGELAFFLLLGISFVIPLLMQFYSLKEVLPFTAWTDNQALHFDYYTKDNNNHRERHVVSFLLPSIRSYTIHSFLKKKPAFIEIVFDTGHQKGKSKPIYIEELPKHEADKLFFFMDSLMVKRKALKGSNNTIQH